MYVTVTTDQGWELAHALILSKRNERLWGIRSDHSRQMSNCEQITQVANGSGHSWQMSNRERFAQVAHDKWANERFAQKMLAKKILNLIF